MSKAKAGDKVRLINKQSVEHFKAVGMAIEGTVMEISTQPFKEREVLVSFPDRPGTWAYRQDEVRVIT